MVDEKEDVSLSKERRFAAVERDVAVIRSKIMDDSTCEWRRQLERRIFELERDLAIVRIRGATKLDVSQYAGNPDVLALIWYSINQDLEHARLIALAEKFEQEFLDGGGQGGLGDGGGVEP